MRPQPEPTAQDIADYQEWKVWQAEQREAELRNRREVRAKARRRAPRDWQCQECGRRMTLKAAERAAFRAGCPRCGGVDIDLVPEAR